MLRLIIILFTVFCTAQTVLGQGASNQNFNQLNFLLESSTIFLKESNYDSALSYCEMAEKLCLTNNDKAGLTRSWIEKSFIYIDKDDLSKAQEYADKIYQISLQTKDSLATAVSWLLMGQVRLYNADYDQAIPLINKSITYYFEKNPSTYTALAYNDIGYCWGSKGDLTQQASYTMDAIKLYEKYFPDEDGELGASYNNLSTVYYQLNERQKAIEYAKKSLVYREKTNDLSKLALGYCNISQMYLGIDSAEAEKYLKPCNEYALKSGDEYRIIHSYTTAALVYNANKKNDKALNAEKKAIELLEKSGKDPSMLARRYLSAALLTQFLNQDSSEVLGYYRKAQHLLIQNQSMLNLRDLYISMSNYYRKINQFESAYEYYKKHILYRDSLVTEKTKASIAEIETKYKTEIKDNEINKLQTEQRIKTLQIEKQNALLQGNILEAQEKQNQIELLSRGRELQDLKIKQQDEVLERQLLLVKNNEQQLQLAAKEKELQNKKLESSQLTKNFTIGATALLGLLAFFMFNRYQLQRKIKEKDALLAIRNNIAKDLHDEIGSTLTSIKILSEISEKNLGNDHGKAGSLIKKITEQSAAAQQGMSDIVWSVSPTNDKLEMLIARMRDYIAHTLEPKNIATNIRIDEKILNDTLSMNQRRDFFLIFKEAINNIAKYANATEVDVHIGKLNTQLILKITDNGIGFNVDEKRTSNGLKNMRARAEALHGSLKILSEQGEGSELTLSLPTT